MPTILHVQFRDESETVIVGCFAELQSPDEYPNQGELATTDPRWGAYWNSLPEGARRWLLPPGD